MTSPSTFSFMGHNLYCSLDQNSENIIIKPPPPSQGCSR